jgi:nucleoside-specific outer membrane channel protein Tsx
MKNRIRSFAPALVAAAAAMVAGSASAADWSDTSIGFRFGNKFAEPFGPNDIHKKIINLTNVSGFKYGTSFFNVDLLESDAKDSDAQEAYVVYRFTADLEKMTGSKWAWGPIRGTGITAGFDWNTKNDPGYGSKKRMLVFGPTFSMDVPGFLNLGVYLLDESNKPVGITSRYTYKTHAMLGASWGIPIGSSGFSFEGYANWIASKGKDEFGGPTATETNIDAQVMYDVGAMTGMGKGKLKAGFEYQYWRNKFGNPYKGPAGPGAFAKTPMLRVEYHF